MKNTVLVVLSVLFSAAAYAQEATLADTASKVKSDTISTIIEQQSQRKDSEMKELVQPEILIPLLIQTALAVAAFWYTIETRKYRLQSEQQLDTMRKQHFLTVAPFLLVGAIPKKKMEYDLEHHPEKFLPSGTEQDIKAAQKHIRSELMSKPEFYACAIQNPTSKLARQVEAILYSSQNKHFIEGVGSKEVVNENSSAVIMIAGDPLNQQEAVESMRKSFPGIVKINEDLLKHEKLSYVIVFYRDIEGAAYAVKRPYLLDEDGDLRMTTSSFMILS